MCSVDQVCRDGDRAGGLAAPRRGVDHRAPLPRPHLVQRASGGASLHERSGPTFRRDTRGPGSVRLTAGRLQCRILAAAQAKLGQVVREGAHGGFEGPAQRQSQPAHTAGSLAHPPLQGDMTSTNVPGSSTTASPRPGRDPPCRLRHPHAREVSRLPRRPRNAAATDGRAGGVAPRVHRRRRPQHHSCWDWSIAGIRLGVAVVRSRFHET